MAGEDGPAQLMPVPSPKGRAAAEALWPRRTLVEQGAVMIPDDYELIQQITSITYQSVNASISGLAAATRYHFRIVATNSAGTSHGSDKTFTTP